MAGAPRQRASRFSFMSIRKPGAVALIEESSPGDA